MEVVLCTGGRYPIGMCCAGHACGKGGQIQGGASACCRAARGSSIEVRQCGGDPGQQAVHAGAQNLGFYWQEVNMQENQSCCALRQRVM